MWPVHDDGENRGRFMLRPYSAPMLCLAPVGQSQIPGAMLTLSATRCGVEDTLWILECPGILMPATPPNEPPPPPSPVVQYYKMAYGSSICPPARIIETVDECKEALEALQLTGTRFWSGNSNGAPRFCSVREEGRRRNQWAGGHFNKKWRGRGRWDLAPVCHSGTFTILKDGSTCPRGTTISTAQQCGDALAELGLGEVTEIDDASKTNGCSHGQAGGQFNSAVRSKGVRGLRPVCKPEAFELSLGGLSLEIDNYELNVDGFEWQAWHVALAAVLGVLAGAALVLCVLRGLRWTKTRGMTPEVGGAGTGSSSGEPTRSTQVELEVDVRRQEPPAPLAPSQSGA